MQAHRVQDDIDRFQELVAVQVFSDGRTLTVDARVLGLGFAMLALLLRAPFLVVVVGAAVVAALARLV